MARSTLTGVDPATLWRWLDDLAVKARYRPGKGIHREVESDSILSPGDCVRRFWTKGALLLWADRENLGLDRVVFLRQNMLLAPEEGYPSGQRGQTVNLLAYAYVGSNPTPSTR